MDDERQTPSPNEASFQPDNETLGELAQRENTEQQESRFKKLATGFRARTQPIMDKMQSLFTAHPTLLQADMEELGLTRDDLEHATNQTEQALLRASQTKKRRIRFGRQKHEERKKAEETTKQTAEYFGIETSREFPLRTPDIQSFENMGIDDKTLKILETPSALSFIQENPVHLSTTNVEEIYPFYQFHPLKETPDNHEQIEKLQNSIESLFQRTIMHTENPDHPSFPRNEPKRQANLSLPEMTILEKDGLFFYDLAFSPSLRLILRSEPVIRRPGGTTKIQDGLIIEHAFVKGDDEKVIDLLSLRNRNPVQNIFSFSGLYSKFNARTEFIEKDQLIAIPEVFLTMPTKTGDSGNLQWDTNSFPYLLAHENAHASLWDEENYSDTKGIIKNIPEEQNERNANAIALLNTRAVSTKYANSHFLSSKDHALWIENQLKSYDPTPVHVANTDALAKKYPEEFIGGTRIIATNERRKAYRQQSGHEANDAEVDEVINF